MRLDGLPKLEDIREMSEGQFVEAFEMLRGRTKDWTEFTPELLIEDSRLIFVVRCGLGITQREFSRILEVDRDSIRSLEAGRRVIIHKGPARRWTTKLEDLLMSQKPSLDIGLARLTQFKRVRHDQKLVFFHKPISKMSQDELKQLFDITMRETEGFTAFKPHFLMGLPQAFTIFRLALELSHDRFSQILEIDQWTQRGISSGRTPIGFRRACRLARKLEDIFESKKDITFDKILRSFSAFSRFLHLDTASGVVQGLRLARKQPLTEFERRISKILLEASIDFDVHAEVDCKRKILSVDFALPEPSAPKFVIEVFSSGKTKSVGSSLLKIREIDHRFRMIKLAMPDVKTVMCIDFKRPIILDLARKSIEMELIDTDLLLICDEVIKLPDSIQKMSHTTP
ncbi:MAG: hypothetical protein HYW24_02070 [Candidatus Aenigmarchaeota archaeon]|nr:hypothetical protein [Candidatus Aenigmarchaeota archaeon]